MFLIQKVSILLSAVLLMGGTFGCHQVVDFQEDFSRPTEASNDETVQNPGMVLHFWAGSEAESDPRVIEVYEHRLCSGQVAVARVTSMPEYTDAVLQPELALELSSSGSVIRQWRFPTDYSVLGVERDRLIVPRGSGAALSIVESGQFEEVARPKKAEHGTGRSCPEISNFEDSVSLSSAYLNSAYLRCFEFKDLASGETRLIAYQTPCT